MNYYRILTYNVFWRNMFFRNECVSNINKLINSKFNSDNIGDFIFLQEVANHEKLLKNLDNNFNFIQHTSGKENMVTLVNKKYNIINNLPGQFMSGRPFLITILDNNLCLINVHYPHVSSYIPEFQKISNLLLKNNISLDKYRLIIGGDFNMDLPANITFINKILSVSKSIKTCCIKKEMENLNIDKVLNKCSYNFDHICDSENNIVKSVLFFPHINNKVLPGSDHFGLYCKLIK